MSVAINNNIHRYHFAIWRENTTVCHRDISCANFVVIQNYAWCHSTKSPDKDIGINALLELISCDLILMLLSSYWNDNKRFHNGGKYCRSNSSRCTEDQPSRRFAFDDVCFRETEVNRLLWRKFDWWFWSIWSFSCLAAHADVRRSEAKLSNYAEVTFN